MNLVPALQSLVFQLNYADYQAKQEELDAQCEVPALDWSQLTPEELARCYGPMAGAAKMSRKMWKTRLP
jgi:hypothetical protein